MKVGILCAGFTGWAGGVDFIRIIIESLTSLEHSNLKIHVIVPDRGPRFFVRETLGIIKFVTNTLVNGKLRLPPRSLPTNLVAEALGDARIGVSFHHIDAGRAALAAVCRRLSLDILIPSGISLGADFSTPWVGYIDDFQYKYIPENYTSVFSATRDRLLAKMVSEAKTIVVNAHAVANDVAKFLPEGAAKIIVLPFSAAPTKNWFDDDVSILKKYAIGARYFMISNQFWLHKRHDVAFSAFHQLVREDSNLQLVCTGRTDDGRDPNYFPRLMRFIEEHGLTERVRILGLIPKREQIELMKNCIAVVQPTAFEGGPGGGSIYDAISLGLPTIVSDIPVNREIERWVTCYFPLDNANALSQAMSELAQKSLPRAEPKVLLELGLQRRRACGEALLYALKKSLG